jgi:hypothetical protein
MTRLNSRDDNPRRATTRCLPISMLGNDMGTKKVEIFRQSRALDGASLLNDGIQH